MTDARYVWTWWDREDSEEGLCGFHTQDDLRRFMDKEPGPYRRRLSPIGVTISQMDEWSDVINRRLLENDEH